MLFFGKKDKANHDFVLLRNICNKLPEKYACLKKQLEEGMILDVKKDRKGNFVRFLYDIDLLNKYENRKSPYFLIENIIIKNNLNETFHVSLGVCADILIEYTINTNNIDGLNFEDIDINNIKIKYVYDESIKLFTKEELKYINISDVYEVEINGKIYYHIIDLEDGNFIGIDKTKKLYEIIHNPPEIKLMKETLIEYIKNK